MLSRIPSWLVAVTGATIIIVATTTSSTILHEIQAHIGETVSEISEANSQRDRMWSNHLISDRRSTAADFLFGQALGSDSNDVRHFLLKRTGYYLRGSLLAMMIAAEVDVADNTPEEIRNLEGEVKRGNVQAFEDFKDMIDGFRLESQRVLNNKASQIRDLQKRMELLRRKESILYLAIVFFNLFGLTVVMCKDLPIWRGQRSESGEKSTTNA